MSIEAILVACITPYIYHKNSEPECYQKWSAEYFCTNYLYEASYSRQLWLNSSVKNIFAPTNWHFIGWQSTSLYTQRKKYIFFILYIAQITSKDFKMKQQMYTIINSFRVAFSKLKFSFWVYWKEGHSPNCNTLYIFII